MKPCVSEATTMPHTFADDVAGFAEGGVTAMEVWLTKLEAHLESHEVAETQRMIADRGLTLAAAAYQGGLVISEGEARQAHFDHFRRRLELCQAFGIPTLLIAADYAPKVEAGHLGRAVASLSRAAEWAEAFDVSLALEFRGANAFCSCLDTAISLIGQCGRPNLGVALDVFHYYTGPSKEQDLGRLTIENLQYVQLCDLAGVPRELAGDSDRVMPGEGDFSLAPILTRLRSIGYNGYVSLELMNPQIWPLKVSQVAELGLTALTRILGQAGEMSTA